jgi:hypothetical protein
MTVKNKLLVAIVTGLLLIIAGVVSFQWWSAPTVTTPIKREYPNTLAQWNAWYAEPPEGQNGATFFQQGFEAMQITDADQKDASLPIIGKGAWPPLGRPLPPNIKAATAEFSRRNEAAWEFFQKGMACEQSRYPIDLNQGYNTLLMHLSKLKKAAQMSDMKAMMLADNQQPAETTDALLVGLAEAQSVQQEPVLISQLVRVACFGMEAPALERVLNSEELPPKDLSRLASALATVEEEETAGIGFTRALAGERVDTLANFALPPRQLERVLKESDAIKQGPAAAQAAAFKKLTRNLNSQRAFTEETFNRALVMRQKPFPERLKTGDYIAARAAAAKAKDYGLCVMALPGLEKQIIREARGLADIRLMQTAIALEQSRSTKGGKYADKLAALSPEFLATVPADPFDGQPLRYRKTATGYQLYSIGPDLKDDGGKRESSGKGDLVFEIVSVTE